MARILQLFRREKIDSTANKAVVADSLSDTAATAAALISLIISKFSSVPVDGWFGLVVSGFIIYSGIGIIKDTVSPARSAAEKGICEAD